MTEADSERPPEQPPFRIPSARPPERQSPPRPADDEERPQAWLRRRPVIEGLASATPTAKPDKPTLFDQDTAPEPATVALPTPGPVTPPASGRRVRPFVGRDQVAQLQPASPVAPPEPPAPPAPPEPPAPPAPPEPVEPPEPVATEPEHQTAEHETPELEAEVDADADPAPVMPVAMQWARTSLTALGDLNGRRLDRRAVDVNEHRIGKLEPEWRGPRRIRSLIVLVVLTLFVAAVIAAVLAIAVEVLSVAVNHAVSKSAGA